MSSAPAPFAVVVYPTEDTVAAAAALAEDEDEDEGEGESEDEDEAEYDDAVAPIPALAARATGTMTALAALPPARNATTRPGRITRLNRDANIEANLAQITGQVNAPECSHCAQNFGVFALCVSAPGQLNGSCANCHYNNEGVRCSLRPQASAASVAAAIAAAAAADPSSPAGPSAPSPAAAPSPSPGGLRPRPRRIAPTLVSGPRNVAPAPAPAPAVSGSRGGGGGRVARAGALVGVVRVPRRSRAERLRAIAAAHQQLVELYTEEAERLEEDLDVE